MSPFETFALRFARCVELFRDPDAKQDQKGEFRAVLGLLQDAPVTLRVTGGRLELNGEPCEGESLTLLVQRLELHGIAEIAIPPHPLPAELFELFTALADQPGSADVAGRFDATGADRIRVATTPVSSGPAPAAAVAPADDLRPPDPIVPAPGAPVDRGSGALGTAGILRGESLTDIGSVPLPDVPVVTHDPPPPPAAHTLLGEPDAVPSPPAPAAPPPPSVAAPPAAPGAARAPAAAAAPPPARDILAELERTPEAPIVGDLLVGVVELADAALRQKRPERLLAIITAVMRAEQRIPATSGLRRQYAIALRRICTKPALEALAGLVSVPQHRAAAAAALQRGGAAAVEVLIDRLITASDVSERRAVFDALKRMTEGTEQLIHLLGHREWFVVRNVAELVGELGLESAVPALARQLDHVDERVRKAVGLALAKLGTRSAAEPLRRALRDPSPAVRMQVAVGIGGRKSMALAMPLVVAMEEEKDEAVGRELILALGRIGSPDAVQALIRLAQPAAGLFRRKPTHPRLAAVEALRLAGTAPALGTLEGLSDDSDREVRAAARAAVIELKRKPRS